MRVLPTVGIPPLLHFLFGSHYRLFFAVDGPTLMPSLNDDRPPLPRKSSQRRLKFPSFRQTSSKTSDIPPAPDPPNPTLAPVTTPVQAPVDLVSQIGGLYRLFELRDNSVKLGSSYQRFERGNLSAGKGDEHVAISMDFVDRVLDSEGLLQNTIFTSQSSAHSGRKDTFIKPLGVYGSRPKVLDFLCDVCDPWASYRSYTKLFLDHMRKITYIHIDVMPSVLLLRGGVPKCPRLSLGYTLHFKENQTACRTHTWCTWQKKQLGTMTQDRMCKVTVLPL